VTVQYPNYWTDIYEPTTQYGNLTRYEPSRDNYTKSEMDALLDTKVSKDGNKQLSDENYTTSEKNKLAALGAEIEYIQFSGKTGDVKPELKSAIAAAFNAGKLPVLYTITMGQYIYYYPTDNTSRNYKFTGIFGDTFRTVALDSDAELTVEQYDMDLKYRYAKVTLVSDASTTYDNLIDTGIYEIQAIGGTVPESSPLALHVINVPTRPYIIQIAIGDHVYKRVKNSSTWSTWEQLDCADSPSIVKTINTTTGDTLQIKNSNHGETEQSNTISITNAENTYKWNGLMLSYGSFSTANDTISIV
jgi:hypothetical protein